VPDHALSALRFVVRRLDGVDEVRQVGIVITVGEESPGTL